MLGRGVKDSIVVVAIDRPASAGVSGGRGFYVQYSNPREERLQATIDGRKDTPG